MSRRICPEARRGLLYVALVEYLVQSAFVSKGVVGESVEQSVGTARRTERKISQRPSRSRRSPDAPLLSVFDSIPSLSYSPAASPLPHDSTPAAPGCPPSSPLPPPSRYRLSSWNALQMPLTLSFVLSTFDLLSVVILLPELSSSSWALARMEGGGRLRTQMTLSRPFAVHRRSKLVSLLLLPSFYPSERADRRLL
jgi:hypothetical protein